MRVIGLVLGLGLGLCPCRDAATENGPGLARTLAREVLRPLPRVQLYLVIRSSLFYFGLRADIGPHLPTPSRVAQARRGKVRRFPPEELDLLANSRNSISSDRVVSLRPRAAPEMLAAVFAMLSRGARASGSSCELVYLDIGSNIGDSLHAFAFHRRAEVLALTRSSASQPSP